MLLGGCASTGTRLEGVAVPNLRVVVDCGDCGVREVVPGLIVEGYKKEVLNSGAKVSGEVAVFSIKTYRERSDAARFAFGAFAGRDVIGGVVANGNKRYKVENYYANAWMGIEKLAGSIGELIFEGIRK